MSSYPLSNLLTSDATELLLFAIKLDGSVIDVHYYNIFTKKFKHMTLRQHIEYVHKERAAELKRFTEKDDPLKLLFVG